MTKLTKLKGIIKRDDICPINFKDCNDCQYYDGWGIDLKTFEIDIYCYYSIIIDCKDLELIVNIENP